MIALDSNVVVRMLVEDDAEQSAVAHALVDRALADGARLFVATIVICETVWVLERAYGASRATVADAMTWLLAAEQLAVEHRDECERALAAFAEGEGGGADLLIRERALAHGARAVATFDRAALRTPGFVQPDPNAWPDELSLHEPNPRYRPRRRPTAARR